MCSLFREKKKQKLRLSVFLLAQSIKRSVVRSWRMRGRGDFSGTHQKPSGYETDVYVTHSTIKFLARVRPAATISLPIHFRQERTMERFGVDWPKIGRLLLLFQGDIIHPRNRTTCPCRWAELGRCQQRKGGWKGFRTTPGGEFLQLHPLPVGGAPLNTCIRCLQFAIWKNEPWVFANKSLFSFLPKLIPELRM